MRVNLDSAAVLPGRGYLYIKGFIILRKEFYEKKKTAVLLLMDNPSVFIFYCMWNVSSASGRDCERTLQHNDRSVGSCI